MNLVKQLHPASISAQQVRPASPLVEQNKVEPEALAVVASMSDGSKLKKNPTSRNMPKGYVDWRVKSREVDANQASSGVLKNWANLVSEIRNVDSILGTVLTQQVSIEDYNGDENSPSILISVIDGLRSVDDVMKSLQPAINKVTQKHWQISIAKDKLRETLQETSERKNKERISAAYDHPDVKALLEAFDDAEIVAVK